MKRRIAPARRAAFFGCLTTGLLVHLYAFTNLIPNSDGLGGHLQQRRLLILKIAVLGPAEGDAGVLLRNPAAGTA